MEKHAKMFIWRYIPSRVTFVKPIYSQYTQSYLHKMMHYLRTSSEVVFVTATKQEPSTSV